MYYYRRRHRRHPPTHSSFPLLSYRKETRMRYFRFIVLFAFLGYRHGFIIQSSIQAFLNCFFFRDLGFFCILIAIRFSTHMHELFVFFFFSFLRASCLFFCMKDGKALRGYIFLTLGASWGTYMHITTNRTSQKESITLTLRQCRKLRT
jgi:hypothetical protein